MAQNLLAFYIGDGYLAYAAPASTSGARSLSYWGYTEGDDWAIATLNKVPDSIAENLLKQGSSDQEYGDGYIAASAAAPFLGKIIDQGDEAYAFGERRAREIGRVQIVPGRRNKEEYRVVMLSGPMRGGTVAYGRFDKSDHFVYQWDLGLHPDFSESETARLIDKAISNGEQHSIMAGDVFDSEIIIDD